jgi:hypothetical protein
MISQNLFHVWLSDWLPRSLKDHTIRVVPPAKLVTLNPLPAILQQVAIAALLQPTKFTTKMVVPPSLSPRVFLGVASVSLAELPRPYTTLNY